MRPDRQTTNEMWLDFLTTAAVLARGDNRRADCDGNAMNGSLESSDHQLRQIHAAAKALLPSQRSDFVHGVKRRLGHNPSNEAVQAAISAELALNRLPAFLCSK
jgi:hypothetical protein